MLGTSAPLVKQMILQRFFSARGSERVALQNGLGELFSDQAQISDMLLAKESPFGPARDAAGLIGTLKRSDHPIHFCRLGEEEGNMRAFLMASLEQKAKVLCLWHSEKIDLMKRILAENGYSYHLRTRRLVFHPQERFRDAMINYGNVNEATSMIREIFDKTLEEGHTEVRLGGSTAGSLFSMRYYDLAREWEAFLHISCQKMPLSVYCPYPVGYKPVPFEAVRMMVRVHNWIMAGKEALPVSFKN